MSRILAISDIHGHYDEFVELMKKINFNKGTDKLYILGDFMDRGPDCIKLLALLMNMQSKFPETIKIIKGNHDQEFLKALKLIVNNETYDEESWAMYQEFSENGIENLRIIHSTFNHDDKLRVINWIDNLPLYIEDGPYIFVHAGVTANLPVNKQNEQMLLWGRMDEKSTPFYLNKGYEGKVVIFGHTPTRAIHAKTNNDYNNHNIWFDCKNYDKIGIDCGVYNGGTLGALEICPETDKYSEHYL